VLIDKIDHELATLRLAWPVYSEEIAEHFARFIDDKEASILTDVFQRMLANDHKT
jgi:hypothetical protein